MACVNRARSVNDDVEVFFNQLDAHTPMIALIAPAAVTEFDNIYKLIGFLKSCGILAVFDVAFGAELTIKSYIEYARKTNPKMIIAQPCPAIVNYCEIYAPHLIPYLAPVHSPMIHAAIMIKNYFPEYADVKTAAISPCIAKKREFEKSGHIDFNVTLKNFKTIIEQRNIDIDSFSPVDFDGPVPERAVSFSSPGGLKNTILREAPALEPKIRRIEGTFSVYKYLNELPDMMGKNLAPFLVDCLSCSSGCNGGPGTTNFGHSAAWLEARVEERLKEHIRRNKLVFGINRVKGEVAHYWRPGIYNQSYTDRSEALSGYRIPTKKDLDVIYSKMKKTSEADFLNCAACGYGGCQGMAEAIFNGLNRPENCHHYLKKEVDERLKEHESIFQYVHDGIFLLDRNGCILPSYSRALEEIFRRDMLADIPIMDIFAGFFDKKKLKEIDEFISLLFDASISDAEMQKHNPLRKIDAHFTNLDGSIEVRRLHFAVDRIADESGIQKILVIVRDSSGEQSETEEIRDASAGKPESGSAAGKKLVLEFGKDENNFDNLVKNAEIKGILLTLAGKFIEFCDTETDKNGSVTFDAYCDEDSLNVSCRHDGSGLAAVKIMERALGGTVTKEAAESLSEQEKMRYFYNVGLTDIREKLKKLSCRGLRISDKKDYCQINLRFPKGISGANQI
jgi:hypothetical protein